MDIDSVGGVCDPLSLRSTPHDRRSSRRASAAMFFNQYIDGFPYLAEVLELSMSGALVRRVLGPEVDRACYALELGGSDKAPTRERLWLCAAPVWRHGPFEAVRFVAQSLSDKLRLASLLGELRAGSSASQPDLAWE